MFKDVVFLTAQTLSAGEATLYSFGSLAYLHGEICLKTTTTVKDITPIITLTGLTSGAILDAALTHTTKLKFDISGFYSLKNTNFNNEGYK